MKKLKKSAYTLILMATWFVASPVIIHKIWKSSETKKSVSTPSVSDNSKPDDSPENTPEKTTSSAEQITPPTENTPESAVSFATSDISYFDDALFIGDSRTVGIKEYGTLKNADYFCSVGMSAYKIEDEEIDGMTFDEKIDNKQYGKVYIMLGVNEVGNDIEVTKTAYRAIVEKIKVHQPDAIIYLQANLHVSYSEENDIINNSAINNLNNVIESLTDNKRTFYIDINEVYDDDYGNFTESYTSDGIHPLGMYYKKWCEWLCTKTISVESDVQEATTQPETQPDTTTT